MRVALTEVCLSDGVLHEKVATAAFFVSVRFVGDREEIVKSY